MIAKKNIEKGYVVQDHHLIENTRIIALDKLTTRETYSLLLLSSGNTRTSQKYFGKVFPNENFDWNFDSSKIDDWKTFEKNNPTIALNILYIKEKEINPVYISKHNSISEKQIILLMIPNEENEGWHYLAVKKIFRIITWNNFKK